jgi:hypothetical protein
LAGTNFAVPCTRNNPFKIFVLAYDQGAVVDLYFELNISQRIVLSAGELYTFSNLIRPGRNVMIRSTAPVLATIVAGTATTGLPVQTGDVDHMVLAPASPSIIGIASNNGFLTAMLGPPNTAASVVVAQLASVCGNNRRQTLNVPIGRYGTHGYRGSQYNAFPCTVTAAANILIGGSSVGDGDGAEATMWMPTTLLTHEFIIPVPCQHYTIACSAPGTALIQTSKGTAVGQRRVAVAGTTSGAFYYGATGTTVGGLYINTTAPCFVYADGRVDGDELVIYGTPV